MKDIVVVGAGKIGATIADMLAETGDYRVTIIDRSAAQLRALDVTDAVATREHDIEDASALEALHAGKYEQEDIALDAFLANRFGRASSRSDPAGRLVA